MMANELRARLMPALDSAVSLLNGGDDPNTALAKAASGAELNREQTRRLCEMFNAARTIFHYHANPDQKAAAFPLAEPDAVLTRLLQDDDGTRKQAAGVFPDYTEYDRPEHMYRDGRPVSVASLEKAAAVDTREANPERDTPTIHSQLQRGYRVIDTLKRAADESMSVARQAVVVAELQLQKLAAEITADFDREGPDRYSRFKYGCDQCVHCGPAFQRLSVFLPERVVKGAEVQTAAVVESRDLGGWNVKFAESRGLCEKAANLLAGGWQMMKEAVDYQDRLEGLVRPKPAGEWVDDLLTPQVKRGQMSVTTREPEYHLSNLLRPTPETEEEARRRYEMSLSTVRRDSPASTLTTVRDRVGGGVGDAAADYIRSGLGAVFGADDAKKQNQKIVERLRNQQREVLLNDLLVSDPFISDSDPQLVANAYQMLVSLAPELSTRKEVVRSVLRQAVQSAAFSPFDAGALADVERTVRELSGTLPARPPSTSPPPAAAAGGGGGRR